ncbi:MAG: heme ABC exporter ATP-binding protein CcmA [Actinobacteria bacterium]|nr:MAG: heme ABC exporter ATP-binding protein CcmA [Actinomycetota bacterium]
MSLVVDFRDAVVVFNGFPALAGATFQVTRGEVVLLQGPNGAGKTTLLRACAGLLPVVRGSANVLGIDLCVDRQSVRARVGLLGHANGLFADLTIRENILFWAQVIGASTDEVTATMHRMGIDGRIADEKVSLLSAGQKRRCALACLVVRRAELWLLDEPHAGLDAKGRDEIDAIIREASSFGATVLIASHELERTKGLATRSVSVVAGQVQ